MDNFSSIPVLRSIVDTLSSVKKENEAVIADIKGKKFFAVSIDEAGEYEIHIPTYLKNNEIVFGCELAKDIVMRLIGHTTYKY